MPLRRDASDESRSSNISQLVKDGYRPRQATAIAYSIQRKAKKKGTKK